MFKWEIDWRVGGLVAVLRTLDQAISELEARLKAGDIDTDDGLEEIDDFLGIGFVMMQTYMSAVIADAQKACAEAEKRGLQSAVPNVSKAKLLQGSGIPVAAGGVTAFDLCYAAANYYKHRDEWAGWGVGQAATTAATLLKAGVTREGGLHCVQVMNILYKADLANLVAVGQALRRWRQGLISALVAPLRQPEN